MKNTESRSEGKKIMTIVLAAGLLLCISLGFVLPDPADPAAADLTVESKEEEAERLAAVEESAAEQPQPSLFESAGADKTAAANSVYAVFSREDSPEDIVAGMTTKQKITQCMMVDFRRWQGDEDEPHDMTSLEQDAADIIADYQFGSIILFAQNTKKTEDIVTLTKDMQTAAMMKGGLPMLIAADQEGGIVYRLGTGTALPGNMALGATGDVENARTAGMIIGREITAVGINTTLAPVVDVNSNANNPVIGTRSFGDDAGSVGRYGSAFVSGLSSSGAIGCAKHFPGHGDTATDSHTGLPVVDKSREELETNEFVPFRAVISEGIDMIMTAHILYPQIDSSTILSDKTGREESRPATLSHVILTDILREDMGFTGVVVTDAMNMKGVSDSFTEEQATLESLKAGADIICMPVTGIYNKADLTAKLDSIISYVAEVAESDESVMDRLDEAALRVITLKKERGILNYDAYDYTSENALAVVGSDDNRSLEREMAAKAVTVVRDDSGILPLELKENTKILMMCPYANEMAQMAVGFNRAKAAGLVPEGAEVKVYVFSADDYEMTGELKENVDWADIIIINSEVCDADDMSLNYYTSAGVYNITGYCKETGKLSVVMSVDSPYDVQLYPDADAVLAVYGCKGSSMDVTEVLEGSITADDNASGPNIVAGVEVIFGVYGASGTLPVDIPAFDSDAKTFTDEIIYRRGSGIMY